MKVGLYFGSFNPIHVGHLIIADYMTSSFDEVWFVISPQNPFKENKDLLPQEQRLELMKLSVDDHPKLKISTIEFDLPKPSFTEKTLKELRRLHRDISFSLIIGADNILGIRKWKNPDYILSFPIHVYPRMGYELDNEKISAMEADVHVAEAPIIELSGTKIRKNLESKLESCQFMLREKAYNYIIKNKLYQ